MNFTHLMKMIYVTAFHSLGCYLQVLIKYNETPKHNMKKEMIYQGASFILI